MLKRYISIFIRKRKRKSAARKLVQFIEQAKNEISQLPIREINQKVLLLVRLDEIGDYLLCRNTFPTIRHSEKYKDYKIIFVGNRLYKDLAETLDSDYIDTFIWVDKKNIKKDANYRKDLFQQIRDLAPSIAIELQRTTDVEFGDLIVAASNAPKRYANSNYYKDEFLNDLSAQFYTDLYEKNWSNTHEICFNQEFANWLSSSDTATKVPYIDKSKLPFINRRSNYILCVIGSSKKSKNWPVKHWITLMKALLIQYPNTNILLFGGPNESSKSEQILTAIHNERLESLVGKTNLLEALSIIANAGLMIANDTFAIHARISLTDAPTIVVANGESAFRFSDLHDFASNYFVFYAKPFLRKLSNMSEKDKWSYIVPSVDMNTISPQLIVEKSKEIFTEA